MPEKARTFYLIKLFLLLSVVIKVIGMAAFMKEEYLVAVLELRTSRS